MITERTRLCGLCRSILPETGPSVCPSCSQTACPPINDWDPRLILWIAQQLVVQAQAPYRRGSAQRRWEVTLRSVIAGKTVNGRLYPMAVDLIECYHAAMGEMSRWVDRGMPVLFEDGNQ